MEQQTYNLTDIIDIETTFPDVQALKNNLQNSVNLILCVNIRSLDANCKYSKGKYKTSYDINHEATDSELCEILKP